MVAFYVLFFKTVALIKVDHYVYVAFKPLMILLYLKEILSMYYSVIIRPISCYGCTFYLVNWTINYYFLFCCINFLLLHTAINYCGYKRNDVLLYIEHLLEGVGHVI